MLYWGPPDYFLLRLNAMSTCALNVSERPSPRSDAPAVAIAHTATSRVTPRRCAALRESYIPIRLVTLSTFVLAMLIVTWAWLHRGRRVEPRASCNVPVRGIGLIRARARRQETGRHCERFLTSE